MKAQTAKVLRNLPNQMFELELASGRKVRAHLAGGMKVKYTRLLPGENVQVEVSPFDEGRGKIVDRLG